MLFETLVHFRVESPFALLSVRRYQHQTFSRVQVSKKRKNLLYRAENKGAPNVNDAPLLALDAPNQNLVRHDDASLLFDYRGYII